MGSAELWNLFLETGAPEMYLLYSKALKMEDHHASEDKGTCGSGYGLQ